MAVMIPRETATDQRLEEFKANVTHRFDAVDQRFDAVDQRFEAVDQRFDAVDQRFMAVEQRFDAVDQRFMAVEQRLDRVDTDLRDIRRMMFQGFIAQTTITVSCFLGIAGLVAL